MPSARIAVNPFLNDFMYDVLYHSTADQRKKLPKRYSKKVRNSATTRKLCDRSFFEEKMEIFQALGYNWFFLFFEDTKVKRTLKEIFEKYRASENKTPAQSIIENKVYVFSDRNFAYQLGLMSDAANGSQYSQNLLLNKAGYHIEKWKKQMKGNVTNMSLYHIVVSKYLTEMSLNMCLQLDYIEGFLGITRNDFKVLSYLYIRENVYVDYEDMVQRFSENLNLHKITGCLRRLFQSGMIQKTPSINEKKYQITALGINAMSEFNKNILKANEF